mmetsp:Transcript_31298/g.76345  ORF Transcript_31298/g.76345 Transcript_31298/m.76345 type:complete len:335 (-) Transcript_31298:105-1109(-)
MATFSSARWINWRETWRFLRIVVQVGGLHHLASKYLGDTTQIIGPSMLPTINESGDLVVYETRTVRRDELQKGNIVILKSPKDPEQILCKRIIALEGETVEVESRFNPQFVTKSFVPKGHVWIQGDNLDNSSDSRSYGAVPRALIIGRAFARIYPISQIKWLGDTLDYSHSSRYKEILARRNEEAEEFSKPQRPLVQIEPRSREPNIGRERISTTKTVVNTEEEKQEKEDRGITAPSENGDGDFKMAAEVAGLIDKISGIDPEDKYTLAMLYGYNMSPPDVPKPFLGVKTESSSATGSIAPSLGKEESALMPNATVPSKCSDSPSHPPTHSAPS